MYLQSFCAFYAFNFSRADQRIKDKRKVNRWKAKIYKTNYLGIQYNKSSELIDSTSITDTAFTNYYKTSITNADGVIFVVNAF